MNKGNFEVWLRDKKKTLVNRAPRHLLENSVSKAYLDGGIKAIDEILAQVESGHFDKYFECVHNGECEHRIQMNTDVGKISVCKDGLYTTECMWKGEMVTPIIGETE